MLTGVAAILLTALVIQVVIGAPLLLPWKHMHKPSIELLKRLTIGPGVYVGGTLSAMVVTLFLTSLWEATSLHPADADTNTESIMQSVQQARAHVVCITCFANMALGVLLPRLAHEVAFHDKLRKSHDALKRQAAGLTAEYTRLSTSSDAAAAAAGTAEPGEEVTLLKSQLNGLIEVDLQKANEEIKKLETSNQGFKSQYKSLEKSYDELTADNMRLRRELSSFSDALPAKKAL